jgi:hypothetical protein
MKREDLSIRRQLPARKNRGRRLMPHTDIIDRDSVSFSSGSFDNVRQKFTGKERDDESGLD